MSSPHEPSQSEAPRRSPYQYSADHGTTYRSMQCYSRVGSLFRAVHAANPSASRTSARTPSPSGKRADALLLRSPDREAHYSLRPEHERAGHTVGQGLGQAVKSKQEDICNKTDARAVLVAEGETSED